MISLARSPSRLRVPLPARSISLLRLSIRPGNEQEDRASLLAALGNKLTGTRIHFVPDATIFETTTFDYDTLSHRLRELAFLNAGLTIIITDERTVDSVTLAATVATYCYAGGLSEFVKYSTKASRSSTRIPSISRKKTLRTSSNSRSRCSTRPRTTRNSTRT